MSEELKPYAWEIRIPGCNRLSYLEPEKANSIALYSQQQVDAAHKRVKILEDALKKIADPNAYLTENQAYLVAKKALETAA